MTKLMLGLAAAGFLSAMAPSFAFADEVDPASAKLAAPLSAPKRVTIDGRDWRCAEDLCKAGTQGTDQPPKRECGKLAKAVGVTIVSYTYGKKDLAADQLAACNEAGKS